MARAALAVAFILLGLSGASGSTSLEGSAPGPGWVLFDYTGTNVDGLVSFSAALSGPAILGIEFRASEKVVTSRSVAPGSNYEVSAAGNDFVVGSFAPDLERQRNIPAGHDGTILLWAAGYVDERTWAFDIPLGAAITVVDAGTDTLFMQGDDPQSGVHVRAVASGAMVSATLAEYEFNVTDTFVGVAGKRAPETLQNPARDRITLKHPNGTVSTCECSNPTFAQADWGLGTYHISWEGIGAEPAQTILLAGVDVPGLPKLPWED